MFFVYIGLQQFLQQKYTYNVQLLKKKQLRKNLYTILINFSRHINAGNNPHSQSDLSYQPFRHSHTKGFRNGIHFSRVAPNLPKWVTSFSPISLLSVSLTYYLEMSLSISLSPLSDEKLPFPRAPHILPSQHIRSSRLSVRTLPGYLCDLSPTSLPRSRTFSPL